MIKVQNRTREKPHFFYFLVFVSFTRSTFLRNPDAEGVVIHMITPTKQNLECQVVGEQCFLVIPCKTVLFFLFLGRAFFQFPAEKR